MNAAKGAPNRKIRKNIFHRHMAALGGLKWVRVGGQNLNFAKSPPNPSRGYTGVSFCRMAPLTWANCTNGTCFHAPALVVVPATSALRGVPGADFFKIRDAS